MTEIQLEILGALRENNCNVSAAIKDVCSYAEYIDFFKDPDFKSGFVEAEKIRDDFVLAECMILIQNGDRQAISDYQKMMKQSDDANDAKRIRKEFMRVCIDLAETKTRCLKEYCQVFNASKNQAEKQYDAVVAEYNLTTPYERAKQRQKKHKNSLSEKLRNNKLTPAELYQGLLEIAVYDAENSEYPSERKGAMDKVIDIDKRVEDIKDKQRREAESDNHDLTDKVDAVHFGSSVEHVKRVKDSIISKEIKAIENGSS